MKLITKLILGILLVFLLLPIELAARENVNYWYIKDFSQKITVNLDSSLTVEENIIADCGRAADKHGIFRVLPTRYFLFSSQPVLTPVYLSTITDFDDKSVKYREIKDNTNYTVTWQIGDPNKTVKGVQNYRIRYTVKNAIRFGNANFDEFYWNLNGNFWDIETDHFSSTIKFPSGFDKTKSEVNIYSGTSGTKSNLLASYNWLDSRDLMVTSNQTLKVKEGITASATMSKNLVTATPFSAADNDYYKAASKPASSGFKRIHFGSWIFILPGLALVIGIILWHLYGRDPKIPKTIVPEFEIPEKLQPLEMGLILTDGKLKHNHITAAVIGLAVKEAIKIEKIEHKVLLFKSQDYNLVLLNDKLSDLNETEKYLLENIFEGEQSKKLSDLRNKFYKKIKPLSELAAKPLDDKKILSPKSRKLHKIFVLIATIAFIIFYLVGDFDLNLLGSALLTFIIMLILGWLISQRTLEGLKLYYRIEGFKLYMKTAEKYRQQFNEKENIFEKFLPYAILFGFTELWIKKMKVIYGEDYFNTYHPVWFAGAGMAAFDVDSFNSAISNLSSNISSSMASSPSSSGSGGGGFSGGGGGGGGGGGW